MVAQVAPLLGVLALLGEEVVLLGLEVLPQLSALDPIARRAQDTMGAVDMEQKFGMVVAGVDTQEEADLATAHRQEMEAMVSLLSC